MYIPMLNFSAAVVGLAILPSNLIIPSIMNKYGRKVANIISIVPCILGWVAIVAATSVSWILIGRFFQGFSLGMSTAIGPVLIGEYTTPKYRGSFLSTVSLAMGLGTLFVHCLGLYLSWKTTGIVCTVLAFVDLIIVVYSPESPSWLVHQERYEESKRVFRWLRGADEDEELREMIEANMMLKEIEDAFPLSESVAKKMKFHWKMIRKKEFYKPILIVIHLYTLLQWCGIYCVSAYATDVVGSIVGTEADVALIVISVGSQRIFTTCLAAFISTKIKRKTLFSIAVSLNITAFFVIAGYTYAKALDMCPGHPLIGISLVHLHMASMCFGALPFPYIIAGEIFPLEFRGLASSISVVSLTPNLVISVKTMPYLMSSLGLHGAYCVYAAVCGYCLVVIYWLLPETKDRTLQEIEDQFRGRKVADLMSTKPLTS